MRSFSIESKLVVRGGNANRQMNYYFISSQNPTWDHNGVVEFGQYTNSRNITSRVETKVQFKWNGDAPGKELAFHQLYRRKERKGAKDFLLGFNATVLDTGTAHYSSKVF